MRQMRRIERQITDPKAVREMVAGCEVMRVAFNDPEEGDIYVVPVNYGFTEENGEYTLYFHGAKAGRKADLGRKGGIVGFEMDRGYELVRDEKPCDHTCRYESIIGSGEITFLEDDEEKKVGLAAVMGQLSDRDFEFPEEMVRATAVFRIKVNNLTVKVHE